MPSFKIKPKFRFQNTVLTKFSHIKCQKNLKSRKFIHYLQMVLARTKKNKPAMWEKFRLKNSTRQAMYI